MALAATLGLFFALPDWPFGGDIVSPLKKIAIADTAACALVICACTKNQGVDVVAGQACPAATMRQSRPASAQVPAG